MENSIIHLGFSRCLVIFLLLSCGTSLSEDDIDFNQHIRPLFTRHCTACHGGVKAASDISFVSSSTILPPHGWVVEPGDPDSSVLIERVESDDPDERMPPPEHGKALAPSERSLLRKWIEQGAKWQEHWSFEKPVMPDKPPFNDKDWPRQPMDQFVIARLESEGITPSPDARPERWLRRVTLDLVGLPPSPEDRAKFLSDLDQRGEAAYETVVDRLLDSPAYGERWASVWLDQIRYADSRGLGLDAPRNIWKYRDWVIKSFNRDMPFSEFTLKQIAGDLLPNRNINDLLATAVHRLTQTNEEGGTDDEEFRVAAVLDRVNTTWQAWQGITFGCVQCHSHPYDPFQHEEYYQFAAFFNNTRDTDLNDDWPTVDVPLDDRDLVSAQELDRQISLLTREIWQRENQLLQDQQVWHPVKSMTATTNNSTKVVVESKPDRAEYRTIDTVSRGTKFTLHADVPKDLQQIAALKFTGMPLNPNRAVSDSEWGFVLSHIQAHWIIPGEETPRPIKFSQVFVDEPSPHHQPHDSLDKTNVSGFAAFTRINFPRSAAFILEQPEQIPTGAKLQVSLRFDEFILAAFPLVARRGHLAVSQDDSFQALQLETKHRRNELVKLKAKRRSIKSTSTPVLEERPSELARPSHIFVRGLFLTKGEQVTPGTPAFLPPLPAGPVDRLALAKWLMDDDNPLTARVTVNRIWSRLFGTGIVATEEDFGTSGDRPSHPELLDYLAVKFQKNFDYRFKPLIHEIVLSRTYRQNSAIRPELREIDQQNRLLARGPRHRLTAEIVRDQALACSGLLAHKIGGPPVRPPIPEGVWNPFAGWDKWDALREDDPNRYRRSIYTYTKRSIPYPMFSTFDSPSREFCAPRRLRSNTPLQALITLNDKTFAECAAGLAKRMLECSESIQERIRHGFLIATCREPNARELAELVTLSKAYQGDQEEKGLVAVASVLLNLDEVLTK